MNYEIISDNECLLGESPIWHEATKNFIWLDYLKSEIFFYNPINKDIGKKIIKYIFFFSKNVKLAKFKLEFIT